MADNPTWCTNCLNMSTRPRIEFDERGWCNACVWAEDKKTSVDWEARLTELADILEHHRSRDGGFDCVVPVSGGKDGSYVAYQLRHNHGMNPLTVTVRPDLSLELGEQNLKRFIDSGYPHLHVSPNPTMMRELNRLGFIEMGFPYYGWLTSIMSTVIRVALNFDVRLIFYGEDGEVEYGGSTETKDRALFDIDYMKRVYLEGGYESTLSKIEIEDSSDSYFWRFPTNRELGGRELFLTHWSYFEDWDPYRNYMVAKEHCGLREQDEGNVGTFTNFAQNDQSLYALHTYLMYLKFGFGRATQDAGIEIRRGAMTRDQAINLVRLYDGHYPEEHLDQYLDYYSMTRARFDAVLDKWVNRDIFEKVGNRWQPCFEVN